MDKTQRINQTLITLTSINSMGGSFCMKQEGHQLIRRKLSNIVNSEKRKKSSFENEAIPMRYIPIPKCASQNNSISLPISRQSSKENLHEDKRNSISTRKFQRNSQNTFDIVHAQETRLPKQPCKLKMCVDEKTLMSQTITHLKGKNERLEEEKIKLQAEAKDYLQKIRKMEEQIRQKALKSEELAAILTKKESACNKMHESLNQKYRQISKLEDIVSKLQKQIMCSSNPQSFTPLSLQSSRIINQLSSQLKYKEIENHLLKKDKFDAFALEEQVKVLSKENSILKDRVSYYIRMNGKNQCDSCSSQSLSLDLSESSPLRRSSRSQISNYLKGLQP